MNKLKHPLISLIDFLGVASAEPVLSAGDCDELVIDAELLELIGHHDRLPVRHVRVFCAVYQERRWVSPGHVLDRHVRLELTGFFVRVPAGHLGGPQSPLPTKLIECAAVAVSVF